MSDNFESFRSDILSSLTDKIPDNQLDDAMHAIDTASANYDINKKETAIIIYTGIPESLKWFIASKAVQNLSPATLKLYNHKLVKFFEVVRKPVEEITTNDIRIYLHVYKQDRNVSDSTVDNTRLVLNSFFTWMVKNDYLVKNPMDRIPRIKFQTEERKALKPIQLEILRWSCKNVKEKALVDFLFSTGCRVSECSDVVMDDIDWSLQKVTIRHGKGNKRRYVFFNAESYLSLQKYLETRTDDCPSLFVTDKRPIHKMSVASIQKTIKKICERSAINTKCTPHVLRHTFATHGLSSKMSVEELQMLLGHASPRTTLIYAKIDHDDLAREHRKAFN